MNPISINGTALAPSPSSVNENPIQIRTANEAIDGSLSVNSFGTKKNVVMSWTYVTPAMYQFIKALGDATASVTYANTQSNVSGGALTFTGILSYKEDVYYAGSSSLVPLEVTIRQV